MKQRKQMRVYDLYRLAIAGRTSEIRGIRQYQCNKTVTIVSITFEDNVTWVFYCRDEQDRKNLIRCVNKMAHFIEMQFYDFALRARNDYYREYHRRWGSDD